MGKNDLFMEREGERVGEKSRESVFDSGPPKYQCFMNIGFDGSSNYFFQRLEPLLRQGCIAHLPKI